MIDGRWPTTTTVTPRALSVRERRQQRELAFRVEVGVRLVEHHQPRIAVERARERDALALAAGEHRAGFADLGVVAVAAGAGSSRARARSWAASTTASESTAPRRAMFSATVPAKSSTSCGR